MKSETASLGAKWMILPIRQDSSGLIQGATFQSPNKFTEHLHSAEVRQSKGKLIEELDQGVGIATECKSSKPTLAKNRPVRNGVAPTIRADESNLTPLRIVNPRFTALPVMEPSPATGSVPGILVSPEFAELKSIKNESPNDEKATEDEELPNETMELPLVLIEPSMLAFPPVVQHPNPTPTPSGGTILVSLDSSADRGGPRAGVPIPDLAVRHAKSNEHPAAVGSPEREELRRPMERPEVLSGSRFEPSPERKVDPPIPNRIRSTTVIDRPGDGAAIDTGIPTATEPLRMTNEVKMEDSAGLKVNNLPDSEPEWEASVMHFQSDAEGAREARRDLQIEPTFGQIVFNTLSQEDDTGTSNEVHSTSDLPFVERLVQSTLERVTQVRQTGTDSVSVVLKPDPNTELVLHVEFRDGAMNAQLHLGRGDRGLLDLHWDELQRRLSEQGIQLSRGNDSDLANGGHSNHSEHHDPPPNDDTKWSSTETFIKKMSNNPNLKRRAMSGFESWA